MSTQGSGSALTTGAPGGAQTLPGAGPFVLVVAPVAWPFSSLQRWRGWDAARRLPSVPRDRRRRFRPARFTARQKEILLSKPAPRTSARDQLVQQVRRRARLGPPTAASLPDAATPPVAGGPGWGMCASPPAQQSGCPSEALGGVSFCPLLRHSGCLRRRPGAPPGSPGGDL